jgi:hypothetical protein
VHLRLAAEPTSIERDSSSASRRPTAIAVSAEFFRVSSLDRQPAGEEFTQKPRSLVVLEHVIDLKRSLGSRLK